MMRNAKTKDLHETPRGSLRVTPWRVLLLLLIMFAFLALPSAVEAAFAVYLKSGKVIRGVQEITEEDGQVTLLKDGVTLKIQEKSIEKIEEYEMSAQEAEEEKAAIPPPTGQPAYQPYNDRAREQRERMEERRIQSLNARYADVLRRLQRIEELEKKSKELQWQGREKWNPRKARMARQEKAEVDKELEALKGDKEALLEEKEELERELR